MKKINTGDLKELQWGSPKGKYRGAGKQVSEALGRKRESSDLRERHPFDVEISRIPAGSTPCPYHSHSAQFEFYHIISGTGVVRDESGRTPVGPGDAFIYQAGEAHQLFADEGQDLIMYVVADNPIGEACYYPDSKKFAVESPYNRIVPSDSLDYYDGEE